MPLDAIPRENILAVIEKLGPVQPLDVRRELKEGDTMLIGAILSEMASSGMIAISKTKRGGSPFYFDPAKPETLERISEWLNEKDQRTYQKLREAKVLNETEQDPLTRVSLGNIPDFSKKFLVNDAPYWRYFLVAEEEAVALVKPPEPKEEPAKPTEVTEKKETTLQKKVEHREAPEKKETTDTPEATEQKTLRQASGKLADKVYELGTIRKFQEVKPEQEVTCLLETTGEYGNVTYLVYAFSRKTLPETLVWKALLKARSEGLPLLICKDSPFPKSLEKKFTDVENVYFKRI